MGPVAEDEVDIRLNKQFEHGEQQLSQMVRHLVKHDVVRGYQGPVGHVDHLADVRVRHRSRAMVCRLHGLELSLLLRRHSPPRAKSQSAAESSTAYTARCSAATCGNDGYGGVPQGC